MSKIIPFHRPIRAWRSNDPNSERIRIGEGTANRGNVTITIVIPTPFAPEVPVRFEEFVPSSQIGGAVICESVRRFDRERRDRSKRRHEMVAEDWKSTADGTHQWSRHAHRLPTKDLTVPIAVDDAATVLEIAAK